MPVDEVGVKGMLWVDADAKAELDHVATEGNDRTLGRIYGASIAVSVGGREGGTESESINVVSDFGWNGVE